MNAFSNAAGRAEPPQKGSKRPTLIQVAKAAGVSRTTASLVLSGKSDANRISPKTTTRVLDAARHLDYSPNLLGRSLHHGTTHAFAFFNAFRNFQEDDLYMYRLSTALQRAAGTQCFDLLVHCDFDRPTEDLYGLMNGGRADGVVFFAPRLDDPLFPLLRKSRLPVVLINTVDPEGVLPTVRDDLVQGMQLLVNDLLEKGHKTIAYIHAPEFEAADVTERFRTLKKHLHNTGTTLVEHRYSYHQPLKEVVPQVLQSPEKPTALLFANDRIAYLAVEILEALGYQIPRDVSVAGYDGIHWPSSTAHVVTSVNVNLTAVCQTAVQLLSSIYRQEQRPPLVTNVPVQFSPGTTVGSPFHSSNGAIK